MPFDGHKPYHIIMVSNYKKKTNQSSEKVMNPNKTLYPKSVI